MPALSFYQTVTDSVLDRQKTFTQIKAEIAQTAFNKMLNYDPVGLGQWAGPLEWVAPNEGVFEYRNSNSQIIYNGVEYSSLGADDKKDFHKWLPQFTKRFVVGYNKDFGI